MCNFESNYKIKVIAILISLSMTSPPMPVCDRHSVCVCPAVTGDYPVV